MSGRTLLAGLAWVLCLGAAVAAPYPLEGRATAWVQPNGTRLSLRVLGDEFYARTVTADGHTVIFNAADNTYYYAAAGPDGHSLVSSGIAADHAPPRWLPTHLTEPAASVAALRNKNIEKIAPHRAADWAAQVEAVRGRRDRERTPTPTPSPTSPTVLTPAGGPTVDTKVGLVILVQFPDDPSTPAVDPVTFPTTQAKMIRMCNEIGYTDDGNIGSIRDYYTDQSNGLLVLTQLVTPILTLQHPRNYYSYTNYPTNTILRDNGAAGNLMATDAVTILKASSFDFSTLSKDSFNDVIATSLLFAGADSGVPTKGLWPFSGSVPTGIPVGAAGVPPYILNYQMTDVASAAMGIGTTCHELGHMLKKYPDLYDTTYSSAGIGDHSLMSIGNLLNSEKAPAPIDIYLKEFSGWATINDLTPTTLLNTTLPTTGNIGYRIRKPGSTTEYFMIENRGTGDRWSAFCPDKGIMIWHVDEAVTTQNQCPQMTLSQHYQCSLVQADGRCDLEHNANPGDITDLFKTTKGIFNNNTTPNANWWDGSASGISIVVSSAPAASMNVSFGSAPPTLSLSPTSQSVLAAGGPVSFQVTSNTTWSWSKDAAWITSAASSTQTGTQTITLTVAPNTANAPPADRTAVLTINVPGGLTTTFTLIQDQLRLPDLAFDPISWNGVSRTLVAPGGALQIGGWVKNKGNATCASYKVRYYLSTDATITASDILLGDTTITAPLDPDQYAVVYPTLTVPPGVPDGTYYAGWIYDPDNAVAELDKTNNVGCVMLNNVKVTVNSASLLLDIASPASDGSIVTNPTLTVSGTASCGIGVGAVYYRVNGLSDAGHAGYPLGPLQVAPWPQTTSWSFSATLTPGSNYIDVFAADSLGNWTAQVRRLVTYSASVPIPTVAISTPSGDGTFVNNAALTLRGTAASTYMVNSVWYLVNQTLPWIQANGTTSWACNVTLAAGLNRIDVRSVDPLSQYSNFATRMITLDSTIPTVVISSPVADGTSVSSASLAISGTAADNLGVTSVLWRLNGGGWNTAVGTAAWSASVTLVAGSNIIDVRSQDAATNFSTIVSRTVTYTLPDTTLPTVAISSPVADGTSVSSASLSLSGSAADNIGVTTVSWRLNGGSWSTATGTTAWSASVTLAAGANTINVQSKDAANNVSAIASRTITLDSTLPTVAITSPAADGTSVSSASLALSGSAADNIGVTAVSWQLNGGSWSTATGTTTWSASVTLAAGANTINVQSRDAASNFSAIVSRSVNYTPSSMSLPTWRLANFGSTSNSGTGADLTDPDKDGISNLLEFAFNLNPNQASAKSLVAGTGSLTGLPAVTLAPNGHLRLEFIRRKAAGNPGIEYKAKFSSTLSVWTDPTSAATVTFIDDTWERVIVEDQPPTGAKTRFARVEVTNIIDSNAPSPLEAWRLANFGSTANSGDGADLNDFDKDGIPNLLEFALGLNPKQNSAALLPQPHLSGANLVLSFTQPAGVSGITYGAEWSQTLLPGSWTAMTDAGSQLQHLFSVPISGKTTLFMRFKVTNP